MEGEGAMGKGRGVVYEYLQINEILLVVMKRNEDR